MALISPRNRYHVKVSVVLTRSDNYLINNYIRSLLNIIILIPILLVRMGLKPTPYRVYTACVSDALAN